MTASGYGKRMNELLDQIFTKRSIAAAKQSEDSAGFWITSGCKMKPGLSEAKSLPVRCYGETTEMELETDPKI